MLKSVQHAKDTVSNKLLQTFKNKRILVTGGTGSIGSMMVKKLLEFEPAQIRIFSRDESKHYFLEQELSRQFPDADLRYLIGDIRDQGRLDRAVAGIDIIFHAAALKHVPFCEYNPFEAIKTNVNGTQNLIDLAMKHNVEKLVAISTDKAVNPNTIMGITKLLMERMIISTQNYLGNARTKFSVVRFGNVLNSRGSVVPTWIEQIKNGHPLTVTDKKMKRFFMEIEEAVELVFTATSTSFGQEIYVLKMPKKNIYDLARETITRYSQGRKIRIEIIGKRDREKIDEILYTADEAELMLEMDQYYVILPNQKIFDERKDYYKN
jgi:UDP-N-acetylglucosamine 4,6-dehydratase/5-epimerase